MISIGNNHGFVAIFRLLNKTVLKDTLWFLSILVMFLEYFCFTNVASLFSVIPGLYRC